MFTHTLKRVNSVFAISVSAGLPNIMANWNRASDRNLIGRDDNLTGAFIKTQIGTYKTFGDSNGSYSGGDLTLDASLYNPEIYGKSNTVTPKSLTTLLLIKY